MTSISRLAALGLVLSLSLFGAGCGNPDEDDLILDDLPLADEDPKADHTNPLVWIRPSPSQIYCIAAPCPEREAQVVNTQQVKMVYRFDWRALRLSRSAQQKAAAQVGQLLLYGRFLPTTSRGQTVLVYQVVRAYAPVAAQAGDSPRADRYYATSAANIACVMAPCPTLAAQKLGAAGGPPELWDKAELGRLQLSQSAQSALTAELASGKLMVSVSGVKERVATVTQAFRRM
jgi:hypothetical protein